jgi:hypothetical protein
LSEFFFKCFDDRAITTHHTRAHWS